MVASDEHDDDPEPETVSLSEPASRRVSGFAEINPNPNQAAPGRGGTSFSHSRDESSLVDISEKLPALEPMAMEIGMNVEGEHVAAYAPLT